MIRILLLFAGWLLVAAPAFSQKSDKKETASARSDSRSYTNASAYEGGSGKSVQKNRRSSTQSAGELKKQAYKRNKQAYRKKSKGDCDCPGSKKGQRIRRRARAN
jgi:hypothetical protein